MLLVPSLRSKRVRHLDASIQALQGHLLWFREELRGESLRRASEATYTTV